MARNVTARDLLVSGVRSLPGDRSLHQAMRALVDLQDDPALPNALLIVDADGNYQSVLTARLLLKSLLPLWMPSKAVRDDDAVLERELFALLAERGKLQVQDALIRGLPNVGPDARLLEMIGATCEQRLEYLPVVAAGKAIGVVPVNALFAATAGLALTPEHEGIRLDRETPQ